MSASCCPLLQFSSSDLAQGIDASRNEPELALAYRKIDKDSEKRGRDRTGEQHTRLHQIDSGEDEFTQPASADQECQRCRADVNGKRCAYPGEYHKQRVGQFDANEYLQWHHAHAARSFDEV